MTNGHFCGLIPLTSKTIEAGVTLQAHPQRVPGAGKGTKSGAANGPLRAGGKGKPEYPLTRCLRYGVAGVLASGKVAVFAASKVVPRIMYLFVLDSVAVEGAFIFRRNRYEAW